MSNDTSNQLPDGAGNATRHDQLALIRIQGMHCHKCQNAIQKALLTVAGVHEVEVDFPSSQASILFDPNLASINQLMDAVKQAGYQPMGFSQNPANPAEMS